MAEYYPLLAKAVAGLPNSTPELRRAVYERARTALLKQLKSLDPPIADADVARETDALDGAVARLEAELLSSAGEPQPDQTQDNTEAKPIPQPAAQDEPAPDQAAATAETTKTPARTLTPRPAMPPRRPLTATPAPGRRPMAGAPASAQLSVPVAEKTIGTAVAQAAAANVAHAIDPPTKPQKAPPVEVREAELADPPQSDAVDALDDTYDDFQQPRPPGVRLYPPQPPANTEDRRNSFRLWMVGGIVAVVVAAVAVAAWTLRDRPDQLAKLKPHATAESEQGGKISERVGDKPDVAADSGTSGAPAVAPLGAAAAPPASPTDASQSQAAQSQAAQSQAAQSQASQAPAAAKPADGGPSVPVSYRAALLVEAPNEPNKYKTYEGTVIWRLDNVSSGNGQPPTTAVRADIDVPSDNLKVALTLQKNTDPSLPASHTITIDFIVKPDTGTGGVQKIGVPQMRADSVPSGDALSGIPVPTIENSFLVGLSRGASEATNLDLLRSRAWVDIPILLGNGKIAKLTFEKGTSGARAIDDAINAWNVQ